MTISINVGGVWKEVDTPKINVAGVWKTPDVVSINVGGVWKQVWPEPTPPVLTLNNLSSTDTDTTSPYSSQVGIRVLPDGDVQELSASGSWVSQNSGVEWTDDAGATPCEVMLEKTSGTVELNGPALDEYHAITEARQWTFLSVSSGSTLWTGTLTIREIADPSNVATCTVSLDTENGVA